MIDTCSWSADLTALERDYNLRCADLRFAALPRVDRRLLCELGRLAARAVSDARRSAAWEGPGAPPPDEDALHRLLLLVSAANARLWAERAGGPSQAGACTEEEVCGLAASLVGMGDFVLRDGAEGLRRELWEALAGLAAAAHDADLCAAARRRARLLRRRDARGLVLSALAAAVALDRPRPAAPRAVDRVLRQRASPGRRSNEEDR